MPHISNLFSAIVGPFHHYGIVETSIRNIGPWAAVLLTLSLAVFILILGFWLLMLIHAVKYEIPHKALWIAILSLTFITGFGILISAAVYYFAVKLPFDAKRLAPKTRTKTNA